MQPGQIAFLWIDWPAFHDWLERWAPLAEWGVAVGTIGLAIATYAVARSARAEARAVSGEATLLSEQSQALLRAYVYPEMSGAWLDDATTQYRTELGGGFANRVLPLRNGGPGIALNVEGHVRRGTGGEQIALDAGSIAPGDSALARAEREIESGWAGWSGTWQGEISYTDLNDDRWITRFTIAVSAESQIVIRHAPPSLLPTESVAT
jgi:hypothetical protein